MGTGLKENPNFAGPGQPPTSFHQEKKKDEGPVEFKDLFATGMQKLSDVKDQKSSDLE